MNVLKRYDIAFRGLGDGAHDYAFEMGDDFFAAFENSGILGGNARADVRLEKTGSGLMLHFAIRGSVRTECDRCLEECTLPVEYEGELAVKPAPGDIGDGERYDGEVMWMAPGEHEINVAQYIYESILLSLPMQRFHPDGPDGRPGCDPALLAKAGIISAEEFERRSAAEEQYALKDSPVGDALQALKDKMENERK